MPKIKAGTLRGCGNAEASAAYAFQVCFCVPKGEEFKYPSLWILGEYSLDTQMQETQCGFAVWKGILSVRGAETMKSYRHVRRKQRLNL